MEIGDTEEVTHSVLDMHRHGERQDRGLETRGGFWTRDVRVGVNKNPPTGWSGMKSPKETRSKGRAGQTWGPAEAQRQRACGGEDAAGARRPPLNKSYSQAPGCGRPRASATRGALFPRTR